MNDVLNQISENVFVPNFDYVYVEEKLKSVVVDGETYTKTTREFMNRNSIDDYNNGKLNKFEIDEFEIIGLPKYYIYLDDHNCEFWLENISMQLDTRIYSTNVFINFLMKFFNHKIKNIYYKRIAKGKNSYCSVFDEEYFIRTGHIWVDIFQYAGGNSVSVALDIRLFYKFDFSKLLSDWYKESASKVLPPKFWDCKLNENEKLSLTLSILNKKIQYKEEYVKKFPELFSNLTETYNY